MVDEAEVREALRVLAHRAERLRRGADRGLGLVRARWMFRGCERGRSVRAEGVVKVDNRGRVALGDRVTFLGGMIPSELICHPGGELIIGSGTLFNYGASLEAHRSIRIGARCMLASFVRIADRSGHRVEPIIVGDDVWIAHGAIIEPGVTIGDGSVVAAGAVVVTSVPPGRMAIGNPARSMILDLR